MRDGGQDGAPPRPLALPGDEVHPPLPSHGIARGSHRRPGHRNAATSAARSSGTIGPAECPHPVTPGGSVPRTARSSGGTTPIRHTRTASHADGRRGQQDRDVIILLGILRPPLHTGT